MLSRALLTFFIAVLCIIGQTMLQLDFITRPRASLVFTALTMGIVSVLFFSTMFFIAKHWNHPSASMLRFSASGLLFLTLCYPVSLYFISMLIPPGD